MATSRAISQDQRKNGQKSSIYRTHRRAAEPAGVLTEAHLRVDIYELVDNTRVAVPSTTASERKIGSTAIRS